MIQAQVRPAGDRRCGRSRSTPRRRSTRCCRRRRAVDPRWRDVMDRLAASAERQLPQRRPRRSAVPAVLPGRDAGGGARRPAHRQPSGAAGRRRARRAPGDPVAVCVDPDAAAARLVARRRSARRRRDARRRGPRALREMYREWPFFRSLIDLLQMALAKADPAIAAHYDRQLAPAGSAAVCRVAAGAPGADHAARCWRSPGRDTLLADNPVLRRSIDVRNPYVDPINLVQVELLRRLAALRDEPRTGDPGGGRSAGARRRGAAARAQNHDQRHRGRLAQHRMNTMPATTDTPRADHGARGGAAADRRDPQADVAAGGEPGAGERHELPRVAAAGARDSRAVARRRPRRRRAVGDRSAAARSRRVGRRGARSRLAERHAGRRAGAPGVHDRPSRGRAADQPRAGVRRARRRRSGAHVRLRPAAAESPRDGRAVGRAALQAGTQLRAHRQVLRRRRVDDRARDQGPAPDRGRSRAAGPGERPAAGGAARALRLLAHPRDQPRDAQRLRADDAGRAHQHHGPHPRRVGHRQGADRAGDSLQLAALGQAVREGELRGAAGLAHRVGALRLREGRVHRRRGAQAGAVRARRRRHAAARRDRRGEPRRPGQAAARRSRSASSSGWAASSRSRSTCG